MIQYINDMRRMQQHLKDNEADKKRGLSYTDETNNSGNFNIKKKQFNTDNPYFLRGGLYIPTIAPHSMDKKIQQGIADLFEEFDRKTKNTLKQAQEVKYRKIIPNTDNDFLDILSLQNIQKIIHWIYKNNYLVHYGVLDNIYYSIADLLEPLIMQSGNKNYPKEEAVIFKSMVTEIVCQHKDDFISLAKKYGLPNVSDLKSFYEEFKNFINSYIGEILSNQSINCADRFLNQDLDYKSAQILLSGNKDKVLIDQYAEEYTTWVSSFPKSYYVIDKQCAIEKVFNELQIPKRLANFEDSKSNKGLQLADYIVNILKDYIDFLNGLGTDDLIRVAKAKKDSLPIVEFAKVLSRSRNYSPLLTDLVGTQNLYRKMLWFENFLTDN